MATPKEAFVPHKNVPGPPRLEMVASDNSGVVNTDPMFIADRIAIVNHVMAYAYLIDEGRWDEWFGLFTDDVDFETTAPEVGTLILHGKKIFQDFVHHRYVVPGKTSKTVRRHTQGNCHVAEQTATTAKVRTYMFISSVPKADHLHMLTSGTYNADLVKRDDKWKISRWYIEVDAPLSPSKLPEGFPTDQMEVSLDPSQFRFRSCLVGLLKSGDVYAGGQHDVKDKYIAPTILVNTPVDSPVMQEEIFGPVLPVLEVNSVEEVIEYVNARPKPLGLYVFAEDLDIAERILDSTESGDAGVNDCTIQPLMPELPFGGVGNSGMGKYHGEWGFRSYTNARGVLYRGTAVDGAVRYPPYPPKPAQ